MVQLFALILFASAHRCSGVCDPQTFCSAAATLSRSVLPDGSCQCICRNSFSGPQCESCPGTYSGINCDQCAAGLVNYPICIAGTTGPAAPTTPQAQLWCAAATTAGVVGSAIDDSDVAGACPAIDAAALTKTRRTCDGAICECQGGAYDAWSGQCSVPVGIITALASNSTACGVLLCAMVGVECVGAMMMAQALAFPASCGTAAVQQRLGQARAACGNLAMDCYACQAATTGRQQPCGPFPKYAAYGAAATFPASTSSASFVVSIVLLVLLAMGE